MYRHAIHAGGGSDGETRLVSDMVQMPGREWASGWTSSKRLGVILARAGGFSLWLKRFGPDS